LFIVSFYEHTRKINCYALCHDLILIMIVYFLILDDDWL